VAQACRCQDVPRTRSTKEDPGLLYQDARWPRIARVSYGFFAFPLWIVGLVGSISTGVASHVVLALALFTPPIAICEWRMRKMGLVITSEGIELVRPLNRTRIAWHEIDSFKLFTPPGFMDYGYRRIGVSRRRHGIIPRVLLRIPTVWITVDTRWPPWMRGPSNLKWAGGEVTDVLEFLNDQLETHRPSSPRPESHAGHCRGLRPL